jgi:hypothetical protein
MFHFRSAAKTIGTCFRSRSMTSFLAIGLLLVTSTSLALIETPSVQGQGCIEPPPPRCHKPPGCFCPWDPILCECDCGCPVIIDKAGDGIRTTNINDGVDFDLTSDGVLERTAWVAAGADDGFVAMDRNANGKIDNGTELFGNTTPQTPSDDPNGFLALAEFDKPDKGGNGDGVLSNRDTAYSSLLFWQDTNHNGVSESKELSSLSSAGVGSIELSHKSSLRHDEFGNWFRFKAKVEGRGRREPGKWAWDVFFRSRPIN